MTDIIKIYLLLGMIFAAVYIVWYYNELIDVKPLKLVLFYINSVILWPYAMYVEAKYQIQKYKFCKDMAKLRDELERRVKDGKDRSKKQN